MKKNVLILTMISMAFMLMACNLEPITDEIKAEADKLYKESADWEVALDEQFDNDLDTQLWQKHTGKMHSNVCSWGPECQAYQKEGKLYLPLIRKSGKDGDKPYQYIGTQISTRPQEDKNWKEIEGTGKRYHYGRYEASFKCTLGSGKVFAFFNYGRVFDKSTNMKRTNEIDFEVLGRANNRISCNTWWDQSDHETTNVYDFTMKGIDTSKEFHKFCFIWQEGKIYFYVDGKFVRKETGEVPKEPIPLYLSCWMANWSAFWAGYADPKSVGSDEKDKANAMVVDWVKVQNAPGVTLK